MNENGKKQLKAVLDADGFVETNFLTNIYSCLDIWKTHLFLVFIHQFSACTYGWFATLLSGKCVSN